MPRWPQNTWPKCAPPSAASLRVSTHFVTTTRKRKHPQDTYHGCGRTSASAGCGKTKLKKLKTSKNTRPQRLAAGKHVTATVVDTAIATIADATAVHHIREPARRNGVHLKVSHARGSGGAGPGGNIAVRSEFGHSSLATREYDNQRSRPDKPVPL